MIYCCDLKHFISIEAALQLWNLLQFCTFAAFSILQHQVTDSPEYLLTKNAGRTCRPWFYCRIVTTSELPDFLLSITASRTTVMSQRIFVQLIFLTDKTPLLKNLHDLKHPKNFNAHYTKDISAALSDQDSVDESDIQILLFYRTDS